MVKWQTNNKDKKAEANIRILDIKFFTESKQAKTSI